MTNVTAAATEADLGHLNPMRYRGYYYNYNLGLYYLTTRYYDPETGRFTSADDSSYLAPNTVNGLNLYAYCNNNPVMNVDPSGHAWYEFWNWDWNSIGKIALGVVAVAALVVGSIFTCGMLSVVLAGAAIGAGIGFASGGISGLASGGGLAGFANGALSGTITGAISGAIAASGWGIGAQMGVNAALSAGSYAVNQTVSGENITLGGLLVSGVLGAVAGYFGGHGWQSAAMGGSTLRMDVVFNLSKNFFKHSFAYVGASGLKKMISANILAGISSGLYSKYFRSPLNKEGQFFGV